MDFCCVVIKDLIANVKAKAKVFNAQWGRGQSQDHRAKAKKATAPVLENSQGQGLVLEDTSIDFAVWNLSNSYISAYVLSTTFYDPPYSAPCGFFDVLHDIVCMPTYLLCYDYFI